MNINKIDLANNSKVYLIDNFLDETHLQIAHDLCDTYYSNREDWEQPDWTKHRYVYKGGGEKFKKIWQYFGLEGIADVFDSIVDKDKNFIDLQLWCDLPNIPILDPHIEAGAYLGQLYITKSIDSQYPIHGTSIYNDNKQLLFTMPYRNNFCWFFDKCTSVMHGRNCEVPKGLERFSFLFRYE